MLCDAPVTSPDTLSDFRVRWFSITATYHRLKSDSNGKNICQCSPALVRSNRAVGKCKSLPRGRFISIKPQIFLRRRSGRVWQTRPVIWRRAAIVHRDTTDLSQPGQERCMCSHTDRDTRRTSLGTVAQRCGMV